MGLTKINVNCLVSSRFFRTFASEIKKIRNMDIKEVRNNLIKDLENEYTPSEIELIDIRLDEIAEMEHMSLEDLDYYCTANSSEMFACIFDYKEFNKKNFEVD